MIIIMIIIKTLFFLHFDFDSFFLFTKYEKKIKNLKEYSKLVCTQKEKKKRKTEMGGIMRYNI